MSPLDLDPTFESMSGLITIRNFVMTVCLIWLDLVCFTCSLPSHGIIVCVLKGNYK